MRKILKFTLLSAFSLTFQNQIWGNLTFNQSLWTIIKVALILAIFEILLKPLLRILLLPINLLTLGLFRIVINTVGFYMAIFLLSDFQVNPIHTTTFIWQGINIPALNFTGFLAFAINSTTQNIIFGIFKYILKPLKDKK
jgi:putative membrane protein